MSIEASARFQKQTLVYDDGYMGTTRVAQIWFPHFTEPEPKEGHEEMETGNMLP